MPNITHSDLERAKKLSALAESTPAHLPEAARACGAMAASSWLERDGEPMPETIEDLARFAAKCVAASVKYLRKVRIVDYSRPEGLNACPLVPTNTTTQAHRTSQLSAEQRRVLDELVKGGIKREALPNGDVMETGAIALVSHPNGTVSIQGDFENAPEEIKAQVMKEVAGRRVVPMEGNYVAPPRDLISEMLDNLSRGMGNKKPVLN